MTGDGVVGTVEVVDEDGTFTVPERYHDAAGLVIRDPSKTVQFTKGLPTRRDGTTRDEWYFGPTVDLNPNLAPDRVSIKVYGEAADVWRVEGVDRIDTSDGDK